MIARRLAFVLFLGSVLGFVLLIGSDRGEAAPISFQAVDTADPFARHCAPCHGPTGEGTDYGPALAGSQLSADDRIDLITNGSSAMPAFGSILSADQVVQLADPTNPLYSGGLYLQQCGPCHGPTGEGGVGPGLQSGSFADADLRAVIASGSEAMPAFEATLTPGQIDGLVAYVQSLTGPTPVDAALLYAEQCAGCHGARGEGGIAPSLQASTADRGDLLAVIRDGLGSMPAYAPTLSAEELEALAAFSAGLQTVPGGTPIERGAAIYEAECASCHGVDAAGGSGPNLRTSTLSHDDLRGAVEQGKGTMPAFTGRLDADEIEDVIVFLEDLAVEPDPGPSMVVQGAELFESNCARCHGPDATGGTGPSLKFSNLTDVEMVSVITNGVGSMPAFAEILTSSDTTALVAYVESTRQASGDPSPLSAVEHGREVYVTSCASCHGLDGMGGVGPSLASTRLSANEIISQVFGLHADRMPAFEGLLDASQVQDVARYLLTIEGEPPSQIKWILAGALVLFVLIGAVIVWYTGWPERWARPSE